MKVGTVCFATKRGLGYLAKSFYDNRIITHPAYIHHGSIETQEDWYPNGYAPGKAARRLAQDEGLRELIKSVDWMIYFETPFDWSLFDYARSVGTKSALMTMYECTPATLPYVPDLYLCPSLLDLEYFPDNSTFIPIPVDPDRTKWRLRERAEKYVHNGGYLGLQGREGTLKVIEAMKYVKSPLTLKVRCQKSVGKTHERMAAADSRIEYECGVARHGSLYANADVSVGAQIWNGCSLPLQEAFAAGLLVMNTDRFPMNTWLPNEPLIPVARKTRGSAARNFTNIEICNISPADIAQKMDEYYGTNIEVFSRRGRDWAEQNSWDRLRPRYMKALENA
jgi:hypothetical protein